MRFFAIWTPDTLPQRLAESAQTVEICERLDDQVAHVHALHWRAAACLEAGDMAAAQRCVEHESELAQRVRQPAALWLAAYNETNLAIALGRLGEADELAPQALALGQRSDQPDALAVFAAQLASLRFEQGRLGELLPLIERVLEEHPGITGFRALRALGHCEVGDHAAAREAIKLDRGSHFAELAYDVTWSSVACIYAHVCARLGERDAARTLYRLLAPWHDQVPLSVVAWGCVSHYLGMLATALREFPSATEHLAHAAHVHRCMGTPVWAARTKLETARLLAAEGGRGSGPRSRRLAEQALAAARELGCATIARDGEALIGDTGVHAVHT
jgi:tetratricopeptide (TPR) repeat protein